MDIETVRQANIAQNRDRLRQLGIWTKNDPKHRVASTLQRQTKRPKIVHKPSAQRSSARIAAIPAKPTYISEPEERTIRQQPAKIDQNRRAGAQQVSIGTLPSTQIVELQKGWTMWKTTGAVPKRDEDMRFHFADVEGFTPNKSPEEMLREGCFGGSYFRPLYSQHLRTTIQDDYTELPASWYEGLDVAKYLTAEEYDAEVNKYKVRCGQTIEEWEAAGWIMHQFDVRGWFQWYCRFFQGRRCEDDERQVSRWRKCVGPTGRWRRSLLKKYRTMGVREVFDDGEDDEQEDVSPVMHQTCFHWAYEYVNKRAEED